ncbi:baseplate J/gp47 family protein [Jeongeupia chitinilytica]|uniref:Tail protein n=1 Tax=Jeongeupia chitinilytica TaxID=1041641 RepID=A0ABQ3H335_9NEIS|nr:baseplate J/gp47 family protein [Jeongeupia chitinilytica]GHD63890.1 tail protein [Jeongeupia chitinilytica]
MPFLVPTFAQIRDDLLRDLKNQLPEADTGLDSDYFVRASSVASAVEGLYQHQAWIVRQIFPDTADRAYLELHARVRRLNRKPAVAAQGQLRVTGTPGSAIPVGTSAKRSDQTYITTQAAVIDASGVVNVSVAAVVAGLQGNAPTNSVAELTAAPSGVTSQAALVTMTGGVDEESDSELLARLLELIRRPPAGGNKYDFRRWALAVPGVTNAYVYPLRRGVGTVDVVITAAGGLPAPDTITAAQAYIDDVRPVTAKNAAVIAPTIKTVPVTVAVTPMPGYTVATLTPAITAAVTGFFDGIAPGDQLIKSKLEALISDLPGVADRQVSAPASNVTAVIDAAKVEWLRVGAITVGLL